MRGKPMPALLVELGDICVPLLPLQLSCLQYKEVGKKTELAERRSVVCHRGGCSPLQGQQATAEPWLVAPMGHLRLVSVWA